MIPKLRKVKRLILKRVRRNKKKLKRLKKRRKNLLLVMVEKLNVFSLRNIPFL